MSFLPLKAANREKRKLVFCFIIFFSVFFCLNKLFKVNVKGLCFEVRVKGVSVALGVSPMGVRGY